MAFRNLVTDASDGLKGPARPSDHRDPVALRFAREDDSAALDWLRQRDTRTLPPAPQLVAELDGRILAARSLATGETVADPFVRTAELQAMLAVRASQLAPGRQRRLALPWLRGYARATVR